MTFAERLRASRKKEQVNIPKKDSEARHEAQKAEKEQNKNEGAGEIITRMKSDLAKLEVMYLLEGVKKNGRT